MSIHPALTFNAMRAVQTDHGLTPVQFAVYMAIALASDGITGTTPPLSYAEIARRACVSRSYAYTCAKKLQTLKLLVWTGTRGGNIYGLTWGVSGSDTSPVGVSVGNTPSEFGVSHRNTPLPVGVSPRTTPIYQDLYQDKEPLLGGASSSDEIAQVYQVYEERIGSLTKFISDSLAAMVADYSPAWVVEVIGIGADAGKTSLRYMEAILKRWKREGKDTPDVVLTPKVKKMPQYVLDFMASMEETTDRAEGRAS